MAYLVLDKGIVIDLGKANDRSLARVRGAFVPPMIFDN